MKTKQLQKGSPESVSTVHCRHQSPAMRCHDSNPVLQVLYRCIRQQSSKNLEQHKHQHHQPASCRPNLAGNMHYFPVPPTCKMTRSQTLVQALPDLQEESSPTASSSSKGATKFLAQNLKPAINLKLITVHCRTTWYC